MHTNSVDKFDNCIGKVREEPRPETGCDCILIITIIAWIGQQIKFFLRCVAYVCVCRDTNSLRRFNGAILLPHGNVWNSRPHDSNLPPFIHGFNTLRAFHYAINWRQFTKHNTVLLWKKHTPTRQTFHWETLNQILKLLNFPRVHANGWLKIEFLWLCMKQAKTQLANK